MKILISKILFIFLLFGAFLVHAVNLSPAERKEPICTTETETEIWNEFRCQMISCGQDNIQKRTCSKSRSRTCCNGSCGAWSDWSIPYCENETIINTCNRRWQRCDGPIFWTRVMPQCLCVGQCLETPKNPRYFNNPNCPNPANPKCEREYLMIPDNVLLPVKLDWDDVYGWREPTGPQSYVFTTERIKRHNFVDGALKKVDIIPSEKIIPDKILTQSEYNILEKQNSCFLKSGAGYGWGVKACCNLNGTNCGEPSSWKFDTNFAPEPKAPFDPDWMGEEKKEKELLTTTLNWCESDFRQEWQEQPLSYKLNVFKVQDGREVCHPFLRIGRECHSQIIRKDFGRYPAPSFLNEEHNFFTKDNIYSWQTAVCKDRAATECTNFSQIWRFQIDDTLRAPILLAPPNNRDIPVGLPALLQWTSPLGARSFIYHIYQDNNRILNGITVSPNISFDHPQLALNTLYNWRIMPCWDERGRNCQTNVWSERRYFKTTGRSPAIETMKPAGTNIPIPTSFVWENIPGARSYRFRIQGINLNREIIVDEPKAFLAFPDLLQETQYSWQVKACARPMGGLCGDWSSPQTFTTFKLGTPTELIVSPHKDNNPGIILTGDLHTFSWKLHASHHQFNLTYQRVKGEEREKCIELEQKEKTKILTTNSLFFPLECRGSYQWQVRGCLDKECTEDGSGAWSEKQKIPLIARVAEPGTTRGGLVPCGRRFDNPNTPWVETDRCQIKHIFIMFYLILNFFLWTILPLALVVLVVYTGAMFYFSLSAEIPDIMPKIKALWRSVGIGFGVIFFAWIFVSWALTLLNYQVGIFGPWWQI